MMTQPIWSRPLAYLLKHLVLLVSLWRCVVSFSLNTTIDVLWDYGISPMNYQALQAGCPDVLQAYDPDIQGGLFSDLSDQYGILRIGMTLDMLHLSVDTVLQVLQAVTFWREYTRTGTNVTRIMFSLTDGLFDVPLWDDLSTIEVALCILDDEGDMERATAIHTIFANPDYYFNVVLGSLNNTINHDVAIKLHSTKQALFMWAFHRIGYYAQQEGYGPAMLGVPLEEVRASPLRRGLIEDTRGRIGFHPSLRDSRWPASSASLNLVGVYDLNIQPQDYLKSALKYLEARGATHVWPIATPAYKDLCWQAVNVPEVGSMEIDGLTTVSDTSLLTPLFQQALEGGTVVLLCADMYDLEEATTALLIEGFDPYAVLFIDSFAADMLLNGRSVGHMSGYLEPYPMEPMDRLLTKKPESSNWLHSLPIVTRAFELRFAPNGTHSLFAIQILSVASMVLDLISSIGTQVESMAEVHAWMTSRRHETLQGTIQFQANGLRINAEAATRQVVPASYFERDLPLELWHRTMLLPQVVEDPQSLPREFRHLLDEVLVGHIVEDLPMYMEAPLPPWSLRATAVYPCVPGSEYKAGSGCVLCAPGRFRSQYEQTCRPCVLSSAQYTNMPGADSCITCPEDPAEEIAAICRKDAWQSPVAIPQYYMVLDVDWSGSNMTFVESLVPPGVDITLMDPIPIWLSANGGKPSLTMKQDMVWSVTYEVLRCGPPTICLGANQCAKHHSGLLCEVCEQGYSRRIVTSRADNDHCKDCGEKSKWFLGVVGAFIVQLILCNFLAFIGKRTCEKAANIVLAAWRTVFVHVSCIGLLAAGLTTRSTGATEATQAKWLVLLAGVVTDPYGFAGSECLLEESDPLKRVQHSLGVQCAGFVLGFVFIYLWHHVVQASRFMRRRTLSAQRLGRHTMRTVSKMTASLGALGNGSQISLTEDRMVHQKKKLAQRKFEAITLDNYMSRQRKMNISSSIAWGFIAFPGYVTQLLNAVACSNKTGHSRLRENASVLCTTDKFQTFAAIVYTIAAISIALCLAGSFWIYCVNRHKMSNLSQRLQFSMLFSGYKPQCTIFSLITILKVLGLAVCTLVSDLRARVQGYGYVVLGCGVIEYLARPFQSFDYFALEKLNVLSNCVLFVAVVAIGVPAAADSTVGADDDIWQWASGMENEARNILSITNALFLLMAAWTMIYNHAIVPMAIARDTDPRVVPAHHELPTWYVRCARIVSLLPPTQAVHTVLVGMLHPEDTIKNPAFRTSAIYTKSLNTFEVSFWLTGLQDSLAQVLHVRRFFSLDLLMTIMDEAFARSVQGRVAYIEALKHAGSITRLRNGDNEVRRNSLSLVQGMANTRHGFDMTEGISSSQLQAAMAHEGILPAPSEQSSVAWRLDGRHDGFSISVIELNRAMVNVQEDIRKLEPALHKKFGVRTAMGGKKQDRETQDEIEISKVQLHREGSDLDRWDLYLTFAFQHVPYVVLAMPNILRLVESSFEFSIQRYTQAQVTANVIDVVALQNDVLCCLGLGMPTSRPEEDKKARRRLQAAPSDTQFNNVMLMHLPADLFKHLGEHKARIMKVNVSDKRPVLSTEEDPRLIEAAAEEAKSSQNSASISRPANLSRLPGQEVERESQSLRRLRDHKQKLQEQKFRKQSELRQLKNALTRVNLLELLRLREQRQLDMQRATDPLGEQGNSQEETEVVLHFIRESAVIPLEDTFGQERFRLEFRHLLQKEINSMLSGAPTEKMRIRVGTDEPIANVHGRQEDLHRLRAALDSSSSTGVRKLTIKGYTLNQVKERLVSSVVREPSLPPVNGPDPVMTPRPKMKSKGWAARHMTQLDPRSFSFYGNIVAQPSKNGGSTPLSDSSRPSGFMPGNADDEALAQFVMDLRHLLHSGLVLEANRRLEEWEKSGETIDPNNGSKTAFSARQTMEQTKEVVGLYESALFGMLAMGPDWQWSRNEFAMFGSSVSVANGTATICCSAEFKGRDGNALRALALLLEVDMRPRQMGQRTEMHENNSKSEYAIWELDNRKASSRNDKYLRCSVLDALDEPCHAIWVFDKFLSSEDVSATGNQAAPSSPSMSPSELTFVDLDDGRDSGSRPWGAYKIAPLSRELDAGGFQITILSEAPLPKELDVESMDANGMEELHSAMQVDSEHLIFALQQQMFRQHAIDERMKASKRAPLYKQLSKHLQSGRKN